MGRNLEPLLGNYSVYSIDNIGEGNKSKLNDALNFPQNGRKIADLYALIADSLGVISSPVFGASNGGFIALNYACYYPERVEALALFGPMGLTQLSDKSYMMMTIPIMYPFQFVRDYVKSWAIGNDPYVNKQYGEWFDCILRGSMPSVAAPVPMTSEQKQEMDLPVLLFLGTQDPLVGEVEFAKKQAEEYPNIDIVVFKSGHIIAVEKRDSVNAKIDYFLRKIK